MKVRVDVAELLRAGLADHVIAWRLGVDAAKTVRPARAALRIPQVPPGRRAAASVEDLFRRRTLPVEGGHVLWTGHRNHDGTALLRHGDTLYSALRVAFRMRYEREPEGHVTRTCDRPGCVAPDHTQDRRIRARTDATFTAIFGGARP
ncbi:hypothetical protein [Streptomyces fractus]|uniref:hypothetical protein n=1 Tax=Streptomyces fractus TaxID=641806 RepID=UPI003CE7EF10